MCCKLSYNYHAMSHDNFSIISIIWGRRREGEGGGGKAILQPAGQPRAITMVIWNTHGTFTQGTLAQGTLTPPISMGCRCILWSGLSVPFRKRQLEETGQRQFSHWSPFRMLWHSIWVWLGWTRLDWAGRGLIFVSRKIIPFALLHRRSLPENSTWNSTVR